MTDKMLSQSPTIKNTQKKPSSSPNHTTVSLLETSYVMYPFGYSTHEHKLRKVDT